MRMACEMSFNMQMSKSFICFVVLDLVSLKLKFRSVHPVLTLYDNKSLGLQTAADTDLCKYVHTPVTDHWPVRH